MLRRLLAFADWTALVASLCVVTAMSATTDVATLFWAVLFSPVWMLVVKFHGLYDNDHRRIRHSTLDELPSLVSASVVGDAGARRPAGAEPGRAALAGQRDRVGVGALAGSFVLRGGPALPLAPADRGRQRDRGRAADSGRRRRPARRDPPGDAAALVGYLSSQEPSRRPSCPGSARSPTSRRSPASTTSSASSSPNRR